MRVLIFLVVILALAASGEANFFSRLFWSFSSPTTTTAKPAITTTTTKKPVTTTTTTTTVRPPPKPETQQEYQKGEVTPDMIAALVDLMDKIPEIKEHEAEIFGSNDSHSDDVLMEPLSSLPRQVQSLFDCIMTRVKAQPPGVTFDFNEPMSCPTF